MLNRGKYLVLKTKISACDYDYLLDRIKKTKVPFLISPLTTYAVAQALFNQDVKNSLDGFDYVVPDSQWLRFSLWFLYGLWLPDRVYGPELMLKAIALSEKEGYKIFLAGGSVNKLKKKLKKLFLNLRINTYIFENRGGEVLRETDTLARRVQSLNPRILFVSLGSPLQDIFATRLKMIINPKSRLVVIPVGAAFDFISGAKHQAPKIMQRIGLEWLFRLISEPKRLWRRYLVYAPLFVLAVLLQKVYLTLAAPPRSG